MSEIETKLYYALRAFVEEYDNDRGTWPDNMFKLLDDAHAAISEATGKPRRDYVRHPAGPTNKQREIERRFNLA